MKYKSLFIFIIFTLLSCKKSELTITPAVEKKLCQTAYNSNSEVIDGYNVTTFLDSNIQKTAVEALNHGLISSNADYGCVVIMETNSGKVKAMVNLNKELDGSYKYKTTTAISEVNEPGALMKTFDVLALLEDKKADTTTGFQFLQTPFLLKRLTIPILLILVCFATDLKI